MRKELTDQQWREYKLIKKKFFVHMRARAMMNPDRMNGDYFIDDRNGKVHFVPNLERDRPENRFLTGIKTHVGYSMRIKRFAIQAKMTFIDTDDSRFDPQQCLKDIKLEFTELLILEKYFDQQRADLMRLFLKQNKRGNTDEKS